MVYTRWYHTPGGSPRPPPNEVCNQVWTTGRMEDNLTGAVIGGYKLLQEVGRGGMATVYRAQQISMDRVVAVKMLPPQFLTQTVSLERFQREASIIARLEHRAIVPVHDYGEHEGIPYLVMRYMDSGSVEELLADGPLDPERALTIAEQVAPALDYAHREGVLHRDLKPSNILLDANGDAYLTDFGIARILGPDPRPLTTTGVVGTPSYMSPEQAQGHELDGRSDVYALGVVLFEMLTGVRPFDGETPYTVAVKHVTEPPPSACGINTRLPKAIDQVLYRALAKDRAARYQTAAELALALKQAISQPILEPVPAPMINTETEPSRNEALRAALAQHAAQQQPRPAPPPSPPPSPPIHDPRGSSAAHPIVPPYQPPLHSHVITPVKRRPRRRDALPDWLTWATVAVLLAGMLLAVAIGAAYFVFNDGPNGQSGAGRVPPDSGAEMIRTATAQAILGEDPATVDPESSATPPPTNTPRPEDLPSATPLNPLP